MRRTRKVRRRTRLWRRFYLKFSTGFRQGPISPEDLDAAVRRFKKAMIE